MFQMFWLKKYPQAIEIIEVPRMPRNRVRFLESSFSISDVEYHKEENAAYAFENV